MLQKNRKAHQRLSFEESEKLILKNIGEARVIKSIVVSSDDENIYVNANGLKVTINRDEIGLHDEVPSNLSTFVGRDVNYVITNMKGDESNYVVSGSRKLAIKMSSSDIIEKLKKRGEIYAQIVNILPFGAYLEYNGVTGMIKNEDYSDDAVSILEKQRLFDNLKVRFKSQNKQTGKIYFEMVDKYKEKQSLSYKDIEKHMDVLGKIMNIQNFGIFVRVARGVDVLCKHPLNLELQEGDNVVVKITDVLENERARFGKNVIPKKFRGRIKNRVSKNIN